MTGQSPSDIPALKTGALKIDLQIKMIIYLKMAAMIPINFCN
jgi:hypothetical protein